MNINEKMDMYFNDELKENKILKDEEKKVLAALLFSYDNCIEAQENNLVIRTMSKLRNDTHLSTKALYDAVRSLDRLYGMIERTPGESRTSGKSGVASKFKLNFDKIFNPPTTPQKVDPSRFFKSSETSISAVNINININITRNITKNITLDINRDLELDRDKDLDRELEIERNRELDIIAIGDKKEDIIAIGDIAIDKDKNIAIAIYKTIDSGESDEFEEINQFQQPIDIKLNNSSNPELQYSHDMNKAFEHFNGQGISKPTNEQYFNFLNQFNSTSANIFAMRYMSKQ